MVHKRNTGARHNIMPEEYEEAYNVYVINGYLYTSRTDDKDPCLLFRYGDKEEVLKRLRVGGSALLDRELRNELEGVKLHEEEE